MGRRWQRNVHRRIGRNGRALRTMENCNLIEVAWYVIKHYIKSIYVSIPETEHAEDYIFEALFRKNLNRIGTQQERQEYIKRVYFLACTS